MINPEKNYQHLVELATCFKKIRL